MSVRFVRKVCLRSGKKQPHRHPGDRRIVEVSSRFLEVHRGRRNKVRNYAVGESRDQVGLECKARNVLQNCGQHRWAGGVSANPDYHVRLEFVNHSSGRKDRPGKVEQCLRSGCQADAIERTHLDELQRETGVRHQAILEAARGADEEALCVQAALKLLSNGDGWDHMAARASACQDCAHGRTINGRTPPVVGRWQKPSLECCLPSR